MSGPEQQGMALAYASAELKSDRAVVQAAITQNGGALKHADGQLKGDKSIVMAAMAAAAQ